MSTTTPPLDLRKKRYKEGHILEMLPPTEKSDFRFQLDRSRTRSKARDFEFSLQGAHVVVTPGRNNSSGNGDRDWYGSLSPKELRDVEQFILAHVRKQSLDHVMQTAALGIYPHKDEEGRTHHLLFVGHNTTSDGMADGPDNKHDNRCAERNMQDAAESWIKRHYRAEQDKPQRAVHMAVTGGREASAAIVGDTGLPAVCPCGSCTDISVEKMVPNGLVDVFPLTDGIEDLTLVTDQQKDFSQLKKTGPQKEVWCTSIGHLNCKRVLSDERDGMTDAVKQMQIDGLAELAQLLVGYVPPPKGEKSDERLKVLLAKHHCTLDDNAIDAFIHNETYITLGSRLRRDFPQASPDKTEILTWLKEKVRSVHCCMIRTDDGLYHFSKSSKTGSEKAMSSAAEAVINEAVDSLAEYGIDKVWSGGVKPRNIEKGILSTPSKKDLERLYKSRSRDITKEMLICELPWHDTNQSPAQIEATAAQFTFKFKELYPSLFGGTGLDAAYHTSTEKEEESPSKPIPRFLQAVLDGTKDTAHIHL